MPMGKGLRRILYHPFGMVSRYAYLGNLSLGYRYSFNGKENDADVKGDGNQIDYGMRVYDPRIGKFLSVDPLTKSYSMLTPYQFASNSPVANIDLDGGEAKYFNVTITETFDGKGKLIKEEAEHVEDKTKEAGWFVNGAVFRSSGDLGSGTLFKYVHVSKTMQSDGVESTLIEDGGALYVPSIDDRGRGGLYFVSSSGGGYGNTPGELNGDDAIPINIDLLVGAVGGFPKGNSSANALPWEYSGDEVKKLGKLPELLRSDKKFFEKVDKILAGFKAIVKAEGSGEKVGKAVNEYLTDLKTRNDDNLKAKGAEFLQCESCHSMRRVGDKKEMNPNNKKDTANKGITPQNTVQVPLENFH